MRRRKHSKEYRKHLRSPEWARIRKQALKRARYRCQFCGITRDQARLRGQHLEVHHTHYENLGREQPEDLVVLCSKCHDVADNQRRARTGGRRRRWRRRRKGRRSFGPLRLLRVPAGFLLFAGALKVLSVVLPASP